jgi:CheY-like chemotaxis protein
MISGIGTILVVEDQPGLSALAEEVLNSAGYSTLTAQDAAEALLVAKQYPGQIQLLLTDINLQPGSGAEANGKDIAALLQALQPEMKVLFMSGHAETALTGNGTLDRDANFIAKPWSPRGLCDKVQAVLGQSAATLAPAATLAQGHPATLAQGHPATLAQGHPATLAQAHPATLAQGHPATLAQAHPATLAQGHPATLAQAHPTTLAPLAEPAHPATLRVLVVDDEAGMRDWLSDVLQGCGHLVFTAPDGLKALRLAKGQALDLVITDISMPDEDGIGTVCALRKTQPELKIVAMSGSNADALIDAKLLGAAATLSKPFSAEILLKCISSLQAG